MSKIEAENYCPYCGEPMKLGYVQSSHQIYFNPGKKAKLIASGDLSSKNISSLGALKAPSIKGWYCKGCKKIILDLE